MLRAVSRLYVEGPALELFLSAKRDVFKTFRSGVHSATGSKKVLESEGATCPPAGASRPPPPAPPPPPPPHLTSTSLRSVAVAALAITASLGGIYLFKNLRTDEVKGGKKAGEEESPPAPPPVPPTAAQFPQHVQYLIVGGGTAAFAALRAIRSAHPTAQVLVVNAEHALPYMRPPLSKEVWQEAELAERARHPDMLTFRQWNGKRRRLTYEPESFYTPVERLAEVGEVGEVGGVGVARGWVVEALDVTAHSASLRPATGSADQHATITYEKCLVATGSVARRAPALDGARGRGRVLTLRRAEDVAATAAALEGARRVAVVGGGFLATELTYALADRLAGSGTRVVQIFREHGAMSRVLPRYLSVDVTRRLRRAAAAVLTDTEVIGSRVEKERVVLQLRSTRAETEQTGEELAVDLVVECVGAAPDTALAAPSRLEEDPTLGGLLVNAELQARTDLYVAGDVAAFYDETLGRRRVEHHDHAVVSGRLAGSNMAAGVLAVAGTGGAPLPRPRPYTHQSMFWSDLGPDMGYEAIGIIDSRLPTVGIFSEHDVSTPHEMTHEMKQEETRQYERGVVFYLRERRVVGILLYNMFNRLHLARQVLAAGEFDDLLEVGKLFAPPPVSAASSIAAAGSQG